jgi:hypothetical protein
VRNVLTNASGRDRIAGRKRLLERLVEELVLPPLVAVRLRPVVLALLPPRGWSTLPPSIATAHGFIDAIEWIAIRRC